MKQTPGCTDGAVSVLCSIRYSQRSHAGNDIQKLEAVLTPSTMDVFDVANNPLFVVASYVVAFSPWVLYSSVDHVDGRWREVSTLSALTTKAAVTLCVSIVALVAYTAVQFAAEDWKEGMAAAIVLVASSWLPIVRVARQLWIVRASATLGRVICGVSDDSTLWNPRNSSKFYDNDGPGEGLTDISLIAWFREWRGFRAGCKGLSSRAAALGDAGYEPSRSDYDHAMAVAKFRLRMVAAEVDDADNGLKRLVWLFDNLVAHHEKFQAILCLGLLVHSLQILCQADTAGFRWLEWLQRGHANDVVRHVQDGHLKACRMLQQSPDDTKLPPADYHEVYTLLPAERASREELELVKWPDVMYVVSSTLELHVLTVELSSPNSLGGVGTLEFVEKHVLGTVAGNRFRGSGSRLVEDFRKSSRTGGVFRALRAREEGQPESRWERLYAHANELAEVLSGSMRKVGGYEYDAFAKPAGALNVLLTDVASLPEVMGEQA